MQSVYFYKNDDYNHEKKMAKISIFDLVRDNFLNKSA